MFFYRRFYIDIILFFFRQITPLKVVQIYLIPMFERHKNFKRIQPFLS